MMMILLLSLSLCEQERSNLTFCFEESTATFPPLFVVRCRRVCFGFLVWWAIFIYGLPPPLALPLFFLLPVLSPCLPILRGLIKVYGWRRLNFFHAQPIMPLPGRTCVWFFSFRQTVYEG